MLIYSRAIPEGDQEPLQWPKNVVVRPRPLLIHLSVHTYNRTFLQQRAVQRHNQLFLAGVSRDTQGTQDTQDMQDTQDTQDDASGTVGESIPSSTSASGFTTPLEEPIIPSEAMDVSN